MEKFITAKEYAEAYELKIKPVVVKCANCQMSFILKENTKVLEKSGIIYCNECSE